MEALCTDASGRFITTRTGTTPPEVVKAQPAFTAPGSITTSIDWPRNTGWFLTQTSAHPASGQAWRGSWTPADYTYDAAGYGNQSMTITYPSKVELRTFEAAFYTNTYPQVFSLGYSDDGATFTIAQNYTNAAYSVSFVSVSFVCPPSGFHRWWRLTVTKMVTGYEFRRPTFLNFKFNTVDLLTQYVHYEFANLLDSGRRGRHLTRTGTDTVVYRSGGPIEGNFGYLQVPASNVVQAYIAPVTEYITVANAAGGTGLVVSFYVMLVAGASHILFDLGDRDSVDAAFIGGTVTGLSIQSYQNGLHYGFSSQNGRYGTYYTGMFNLFTTTTWTKVTIRVFAGLVNNVVHAESYVNDVFIVPPGGGSQRSHTAFQLSYTGGVRNNLLQFGRGSSTHKIANVRMWLTDDWTKVNETYTDAVSLLTLGVIGNPSGALNGNLAGALGGLNVYNTAIGVYAFRRAFAEYEGPLVRLRRSVDNELVDVWFSNTGDVTAYGVVGSARISASSLSAWLGSATPHIATWYDQSANAKHLYSTTTTSQPIFAYDAALGGNAARFTGTQIMSAGNIFSTGYINDVHVITKVRETTRVTGHNGDGVVVVGFNGTGRSRPESFTNWLQMPDRLGPGSTGRWGWLNGAIKTMPGDIVPRTQVARVSAYKSTLEARNGLTVNGHTYETTAYLGAAMVTNGLVVGGFFWNSAVFPYQGFVQYLVVCSTKVSDTTTAEIQHQLV